MPAIHTILHAAYLWLAALNPLLPWALLVWFPCFVVPWAIRAFAPHVWELIPRAVDKLVVFIHLPLDGFGAAALAKIAQGLPSAVMGAVAAALALGTDPGQAFKGALAGAAAPLFHELLKAMPWIPYVGGVAPAAGTKPAAPKPPVLPILMLCLALPLVTGCGLLHAAVPVLADVAVVAQDASNALDVLDSWFTLHKDMLTPAQQATWQSAMAKARGGVDGALRSAHGAQELDAHQEAAAFADFQAAYRDLEGLMAGAKSAHPMAMPRLAEPLAMGLRQ